MTDENPERIAKKRSKKARFARTLVFIVILLFITVAVLEIALRLFDPIGIEYFSEADRYFRHMISSSVYGYIHEPHYRDKLQGVNVSINKHGFRGPDYEVRKAEKATRLMILGDSVVFGWGAPQDSIFPARLQKLLAEDLDTIEVLAAGVGSWNTRTEYEYLRTNGIHFDPDILLLLITSNDIEPIMSARSDVDKARLFESRGKENKLARIIKKGWRQAASRSFFFGYLQYVKKITAAKRRESISFHENSAQWEDARLALRGIIDLCHERGIYLLVYLYSTRENLEENRVLALYERYLDSMGIPIFTFPESIFSNSDYHNSIVDRHPNAEGHRIIAQDMLGVLRPLVLEVNLDPGGSRP